MRNKGQIHLNLIYALYVPEIKEMGSYIQGVVK